MIKRIDSTYYLGRAERFLLNDSSYRRFSGKFERHEILKTDVYQVQQEFNLKGFVFGNFVTQEERYYFVYKLKKQLEFLAELAGKKDLGKGVLVIGFGADGKGKSLAHYNPAMQYININKGRPGMQVLQGENSFIHEYGHFLDFQQGRNDKSIDVNFASEQHLSGGSPKTKSFRQFVEIAVNDENYYSGLREFNNSRYLTKDIEVFARLFEATAEQIVKNTKYRIFFSNRYESDKRYLSATKINASKAKDLFIKILKS